MSIESQRGLFSSKKCAHRAGDENGYCNTTECTEWVEIPSEENTEYEYKTFDSKPGWFSSWSVFENITRDVEKSSFNCNCNAGEWCQCASSSYTSKEIVGYRCRRSVTKTTPSHAYCGMRK